MNSESSKPIDAMRYDDGVAGECIDDLTVEMPLQIKLNGRPFSVTMRSPGDDLHLVRGLLFTEGIVDSRSGDISFHLEEHPETGEVIAVSVKISEAYLCDSAFDKRSLLANASCGLCGQRELDIDALGKKALSPAEKLPIGLVPELMDRKRQAQHVFSRTGSTHAAAVFEMTGELICLYEDIGRHNAVDKAIGHLLESDSLGRAMILAVSGRISFEIVIKAYQAGIPFLLAVSAPSSFAVEMCRLWGMSILGFCRDSRATVYANPEQVID